VRGPARGDGQAEALRATAGSPENGWSPVVDSRLREMNWGAWEGRRMAEVRDDMGEAQFAELTALGRDFRPPGGESPREVQHRLLEWLAGIEGGTGVVAVTHKGIIKAMLGLAFDWNLVGKSPVKLSWDAGHLFEFDPSQRRVQLLEANVQLLITGASHPTEAGARVRRCHDGSRT